MDNLKIIGKCLNHICGGDKAEISLTTQELVEQLTDKQLELLCKEAVKQGRVS